MLTKILSFVIINILNDRAIKLCISYFEIILLFCFMLGELLIDIVISCLSFKSEFHMKYLIDLETSLSTQLSEFISVGNRIFDVN